MRKSLVSLLRLFLFILAIVPTTVTAKTNANEVRACLYIPGSSVPAQMPATLQAMATATPFPTPTLPAFTTVDAATTEQQLIIFRGLWNAVNDNYVYPDFGGHDWAAIGDRYEGLIQQGLSDEAFYAALQAMLNELGDQHSYFQSPTEVAEEQTAISNGQNFVGIGALFLPLPGGDHATIVVVFPDSPAAEAGLHPHDTLLSVDGGPIRDEFGISRTRGPEDSSVTLTLHRPGETPHDVTLIRRRVTGALPIDYCLIPNTHIGYIFLPTLLDESMDDQMREALQQMTADASLEGLILDNRLNGGGLGSVAQAILGFFTNGLQGYFVTRQSRDEFTITAEDVGGSQSMPLVVLVDVDTVSYGEVVSGVLRLAGRAVIVGEPTLGNVEQLRPYDFEDGSRAWIASATFEPLGQANGIWEETGIIPDVIVPADWELFTEENDPVLAKAVELLTQP